MAGILGLIPLADASGYDLIDSLIVSFVSGRDWSLVLRKANDSKNQF